MAASSKRAPAALSEAHPDSNRVRTSLTHRTVSAHMVCMRSLSACCSTYLCVGHNKPEETTICRSTLDLLLRLRTSQQRTPTATAPPPPSLTQPPISLSPHGVHTQGRPISLFTTGSRAPRRLWSGSTPSSGRTARSSGRGTGGSTSTVGTPASWPSRSTP